MQGIFISYRRDDAEGHAGRLFEDLADRFGKASVFMDVTGIEPGRDFRKVIEQQVASCGVLLAVIGKSWLTAADAEGRRRLDDPRDFVRLETATALKRDIPVIPVLVHGARMPAVDQLPEALADLAFRNSVELTHARWSSDVQLLIIALLPYVDPSAQPAPTDGADARIERARPVETPLDEVVVVPPTEAGARPGVRIAIAWPRVAVGAAGLLVVAGVGYVAWPRGEPARPEELRAAGAAEIGSPASAARTLQSASATTASAPEPASASRTAAASPEALPSTSRTTDAPSPPPSPASASTTGRVTAALVPVPKAAGPIASKPAAKPAPGPRTERTEPLPGARTEPSRPDSASAGTLAAADRLTTDSLGVTGSARVTPARSVAAGPPTDERVAAPARVEPARANAGTALLGDTASASMATRVIAIGPDTRYVNVTGGEIVRFTVGSRSFVWNFNGRPSSFDLALVAPPGLLDRKVTAYVAPNPLYPRPGR